MNKIVTDSIQMVSKKNNNIKNTQHIFGKLVNNIQNLENLSNQVAQGKEIDPHEISFAALDASRSVEETTSLVRVALQAYQDIMRMSA